MLSETGVEETLVSQDDHGNLTIASAVAVICLIWVGIVTSVCIIGYVQLWRHWSSPQERVKYTSTSAPHVTIVRPVKGLEPRLYDCLASTFRQDYPIEKLHIRFCVSDRDDPSCPVLEALLRDFPAFDAQILVEEEDEMLQNGQLNLGPNPKIRNMSRAYREAVADIIWVIDCNVWVAKGVCGRMVAKLEGDGANHGYKFVHLLPLVVDIHGSSVAEEAHGLLNGEIGPDAQIRSTNSGSVDILDQPDARTASSIGGGRLEETFMSSSHAKFYTAFQTVLIAPCIVGKSTMFRRSHLNSLTDNAGIDYFSENICEDHLIGDMLWKKKVPAEKQPGGTKFGRHALVFGDLAVQPMANMSVSEFWSRRGRWLRVRKFTVTLATLVEPGIESFLCSLYGAFVVTTLPFFQRTFGIPPTWPAFAMYWFTSVGIWCLTDWILFLKLHSAASIEVDADTPFFARPPESGRRRAFGEWLFAWLGREALALPIWTWAVLGGTEVEWRGRRFRVGMDTKVHEIAGQVNADAAQQSTKARRD